MSAQNRNRLGALKESSDRSLGRMIACATFPKKELKSLRSPTAEERT